ncbi:MAG TPA: hypothetical protein VGC03_05160 [Acidimicrobiia bacterium]
MIGEPAIPVTHEQGDAHVSTYIVRVAPIGETMVGTVERPGEESRAFHDGKELLAILREWEEATRRAQAGKASGSTSSSAIRET